MKVLLLGAAGQLGAEIVALAANQRSVHPQSIVLPRHDFPLIHSAPSFVPLDLVALTKADLDITNIDAVRQAFEHYQPQFVVNASAYTAVDKAQTEHTLAFAVNRDGPANLAHYCAINNAPLLHISTDYVFDGQKDSPYRENDAAHPLGVYGQSKWEGEQIVRERLLSHIILRVSWVFGANGNNFVKTILRLAAARDELRVVADQHGCPTGAADIARAILQIISLYQSRRELPWGTYHFCGAPATTWFDFACEIIGLARVLVPVRVQQLLPITTQEYPTATPRPANSVLDCTKIAEKFGISQVPWQLELAKVVESQVQGDKVKAER